MRKSQDPGQAVNRSIKWLRVQMIYTIFARPFGPGVFLRWGVPLFSVGTFALGFLQWHGGTSKTTVCVLVLAESPLPDSLLHGAARQGRHRQRLMANGLVTNIEGRYLPCSPLHFKRQWSALGASKHGNDVTVCELSQLSGYCAFGLTSTVSV